MIKPYRPLLILVYIFAVLGVIMILYPQNEVEIIAGSTWKKFNYTDVFKQKKVVKKDISKVLSTVEQLQDFPHLEADSTTSLDSTVIEKEPEIKSLEEVLHENFRIQYPENNSTALANFFLSLNNETAQGLVRIFHYGDSQLEGDRITSYLRNKFQSRFGGCGVGIVPVFEPTNIRRTLFSEQDGNWTRYPVYGPKYEKKFDRKFSLLGSYFAFTPLTINDTIPHVTDSLVVNDSLIVDTTLYKAFFTLKRPYKKYRQKKTFQSIKLLYGPTARETLFTLVSGEDTLKSTQLRPSNAFRLNNTNFEGEFDELHFHFEAKESPQFYGVALDCNEGIAVDNIGLRGSSGTEFTRMNGNILAQQFRKLNPRLIIFQFGVNVVPGELENYAFLKRRYIQQLKFLKSLMPDLDILVVGVSDMSKLVEDHYESYGNIEMIRDAQKEAAFETGCAFWDLYEVMGGHNAMVSWVNHSPALAGKDYTHFTNKGAGFVAELLFNAIMHEYGVYKKNL